MNWNELKAAGAAMGAEERGEMIHSLCSDPRFAAVVDLLVEHREAYVREIKRQDMAGGHGQLAHCGGSIYAVDKLSAAIEAVAAVAPKKKRKKGGEAEEAEG